MRIILVSSISMDYSQLPTLETFLMTVYYSQLQLIRSQINFTNSHLKVKNVYIYQLVFRRSARRS